MNIPISDVIRRLRREQEITQEELASALGVTSQSVSRWETGNAYPDMELIPKIAMFFGVTTDILFGMNDEARNKRLFRLKQICGEMICDSAGEITEEMYQHHLAAHEEFPDETEFAHWIIYDFAIGEIRPAEDHLEELRALGKLVAETSKDQQERWSTIHFMVQLEDDEHLQMWLDMLPAHTTKDSALLGRYRRQENAEKYNDQLQKALLKDLLSALRDCYGQRCEDFHTDHHLAISGGELALRVIDLFRDPSTDDDGWIIDRFNVMYRMVISYLALGEEDAGYATLEKGIDLLIHYHHLPRDIELSYNCPFLSGQTHNKAKKEWLKECTAQTLATTYRKLTNSDMPLAKYVDDPRMQKQIDRLLEYITETDLIHCV